MLQYWWDGKFVDLPVCWLQFRDNSASMIILSVISFFLCSICEQYMGSCCSKGMQAAVAAVILDAACDLGINAAKEKSILSGIIFIAAFVCDFIFQLNVIYIILAAVVLGIIKTFILRYREMKS